MSEVVLSAQGADVGSDFEHSMRETGAGQTPAVSVQVACPTIRPEVLDSAQCNAIISDTVCIKMIEKSNIFG